ncbi:MAG TPA: cation:proton antiporter [Tissierellaceae bacterium]|nr:cation:proton antiporter [Tissierellaceae bacterium]
MAISLAIIILLGLLGGKLAEKLKLPGLLGMLILGMIIGPYGINLLNERLLNISEDLRGIALIIILLRAGLSLDKNDLQKVGYPAIRMSFIPGIIEGTVIAFLSTKLLNFTFIQGGILGFIIAAVSPAVVVPSMINLIDKGLGQEKGVPTLILAGASVDDVVAITIFTAFLGLYQGEGVNLYKQLLNIPISIILGIGLGLLIGLILIRLFKIYKIEDTKQFLILLGLSILLREIENYLEPIISIASLLGVMTIGFIIEELNEEIGISLARKLNNIWTFAEILLFVLIGAEVNISVALNSGKIGLIILGIGLVGRSVGVVISLMGTNLNWKERLFSIIAYTPKATVQAAIGAVPLSLGVESGDLILAIAVLSIIVTAPLGAIGINSLGDKLLE